MSVEPRFRLSSNKSSKLVRNGSNAGHTKLENKRLALKFDPKSRKILKHIINTPIIKIIHFGSATVDIDQFPKIVERILEESRPACVLKNEVVVDAAIKALIRVCSTYSVRSHSLFKISTTLNVTNKRTNGFDVRVNLSISGTVTEDDKIKISDCLEKRLSNYSYAYGEFVWKVQIV